MPVDANWLAQKAVELLERASGEQEVDHQACRGYLDTISKVLLPKVTTTSKPTDNLDAVRKLAMEEMRSKRES